MKFIPIKINIAGGILSPGYFAQIAKISQKHKIQSVYIGERQHLLINADESIAEKIYNELKANQIECSTQLNEHPNIVSSYAAASTFSSANNWLKEGVYKDILEGFDYKPILKVNIVDGAQSLTPLFTGHLNFIASEIPNFWYLYLQLPQFSSMQIWPVLIFSNHIDELVKEIESITFSNTPYTIAQLYVHVNERYKFITKDIEKELIVPRLRFPIYEGMNKMGDKNWLGIYRRSASFSPSLILAICQLCADTKVGLICLTTWKSLLIKGIEEEDRIKWEMLLGQYGVNIRHSAVDLNWQLPDLDDKANELKTNLVLDFDKRDIRTYGLSFALKTSQLDVSASVLIEEKPLHSLFGKKLITTYRISHTHNFQPNNPHFVVYEEEVAKGELAKYIQRLCSKYYQQLPEIAISGENLEIHGKDSIETLVNQGVYQCKHCFTIYDAAYGDESQDILPGTNFETLDAYNCPTCEALKEEFSWVEKPLVSL